MLSHEFRVDIALTLGGPLTTKAVVVDAIHPLHHCRLDCFIRKFSIYTTPLLIEIFSIFTAIAARFRTVHFHIRLVLVALARLSPVDEKTVCYLCVNGVVIYLLTVFFLNSTIERS